MISLELSEIKAIAMDELGECVLNSQELPGAFFGMRALIKRLAEFDDAESASVPRGGKGDTPPRKTRKEKKSRQKSKKARRKNRRRRQRRIIPRASAARRQN